MSILGKKSVIKRVSREIETDDIFLDALAKKQGTGYEKIETALSQRNFTILFVFFSFVILLLLSISFYFQVVQHSFYGEKANKNKFAFKELDAQRGIIYDRNMTQLVSNVQSFDLVCNTLNFSEDEGEKNKEIIEIAKILNISFEELEKTIEEKKEKGEFVISYDLEKEKVIVFKARESEFSAFSIKKNQKREYVDGNMFSNIIGYVNRSEEKGKSGVEEYYEEYLKEIGGIVERERDVYGNIIKEELIKESESGNNVILNIDMDLQKKTAEVLDLIIKDTGAKSGSVVAMNPNTGEILTMITLPSYDNNIFSKNISSEEFNKLLNDPNISFLNRSIAGEYPIGSTIKPIIAAAALKEGVIGPEDSIYCEGGIKLKDGTIKNDWRSHGYTDLNKAIAESCDVYFYTIGGGYGNIKGLGIERIVEYLEVFGLGEKTGIDLEGESAGFIPTPEWKKERLGTIWYPGDTYNISIGQGYLKATPLQLAVFTSAIANGGKLIKPQIVKKVIDENNNVIEEFPTQVIKENIIEDNILKEVREAMRETITSPYGTAHSLSYYNFTSAGKTGTAETSKKASYHSLMVAFAPYENPEIVVSAIIENVAYEKLYINVIVRQVLDYYFNGNKEEQEVDNEISPN
ncbi:MAG: penicillin-binding protein 2 [Candidatus Microsyncoccus archaeolyticus]|nr:MAG: penicillin-binding protein 2 [Candidatus Parcubacteria bacterium]